MLESFKPLIKNCIDNNKNKTECYYNNSDYNFPNGYYYEFNNIYDKMDYK